MASFNDNFLGISLEYDQSFSQFRGITFELTENLIVKVVDGNGDTVNGATVFFQIGQDTEEAVTQDNGTVGFLVEDENTVTLSAQFDCLFSEEIDILHGGINDFRSITLTLQELPCLETTPFNTYNFLRFFRSNNLQFPITEEVTDCVDCLNKGAEEFQRDRIPNAYSEYYDRSLCKRMFPILVKNEEYSFVINKKVRGDLPQLNALNLKICLVDLEYNQIELSKSKVNLTNFDPNGERQIYASFTLTNQALREEKLYRIVVYNDISNVILFVSNECKFINQGYGFRTVYLQYRNSNSIDGYAYRDIPENFYNSVRLELTRIESQPEIELTQYQEEATGKVRNQKTQAKKLITIESYFFEELAHDAMLSLSLHDDIKINSKQMTVKTAYQIETSLRNNLEKGKIEMYDQSRSSINLAGKQ